MASSAALLAGASTASAQIAPEAASAAQTAMIYRERAAANAYADRISLDTSFVYFCTTKLNLQYDGHPADGSRPYGVNYYKIKSKEELDDIIAGCEVFERSYLLNCLAEVKANLRAAEQK